MVVCEELSLDVTDREYLLLNSLPTAYCILPTIRSSRNPAPLIGGNVQCQDLTPNPSDLL